MTPVDRLNLANSLAPLPCSRGMHVDNWIRHYAAQAFAAHAAFRDNNGDLGYLALIGEASLSAAVALACDGRDRLDVLWDVNYDCGATGEEPVEWLTATLDRLGINPADIDDRYRASDFRSPSQAVTR
jgi:hypothetical protein